MNKTVTSSSSKIKNIEIEVKEPDLELTSLEKFELDGILQKKGAIKILQESLMPIAGIVATEEKRWWDRVIEARNFSRNDHYKVSFDLKRIEKV